MNALVWQFDRVFACSAVGDGRGAIDGRQIDDVVALTGWNNQCSGMLFDGSTDSVPHRRYR